MEIRSSQLKHTTRSAQAQSAKKAPSAEPSSKKQESSKAKDTVDVNKDAKVDKKTLAKEQALEILQSLLGDAFEAKDDGKIKLSYFPQDPTVSGMKEFELDPSTLKDGALHDDQFRVSPSPGFSEVKPDANGNYIFDERRPESDDVNAFVIARKTKSVIDAAIGRQIPWSFQENHQEMIIHSHAFKGMNAFYSPNAGSINFGYYQDSSGDTHRLAQHSDVVSHEAGHGILDGIRPLYNQSLSVAAGGFHEAFGDIVALFTAASDKNVVSMVKAETNGELRLPNNLSKLAEGFGESVYGPKRDFLRTLINPFKDAPQQFLPYMTEPTPHGRFGTEPHAYANAFSGAIYDIFTGVQMAQNQSSQEKTFEQMLAKTNETVSKAFMRGVEYSPMGSPTYRDLALSMLRADMVENKGELTSAMFGVFSQRNMINKSDLQEMALDLAMVKQNADDINFWPSMMKEDGKGAEKWLKKFRGTMGLPSDVELKHSRSFTNDKGDKFIQFVSTKDIVLEGSEWGTNEGSAMRLHGGLQVIFDQDGKIKDYQFDPIEDTEISDQKDTVKNAMAADRLSVHQEYSGNFTVEDSLKEYESNALNLHIQKVMTSDGKMVITRAPGMLCSHGDGGSHAHHDHDHGHIHGEIHNHHGHQVSHASHDTHNHGHTHDHHVDNQSNGSSATQESDESTHGHTHDHHVDGHQCDHDHGLFHDHHH